MSGTAPGALVAYFGYGSLVNRNTHRTDIVAAGRARLAGWRRFWRPRPDMPFDAAGTTPVSLLTVGRDDTSAIDGLLIVDRAENLPTVDAREARYDRKTLPVEDVTLTDGFTLPDGCPLYVYEARADAPETEAPCLIFQSYLDAVLQGFMREFGETGVRGFVSRTGNFETPVLADRKRPNYPRAVELDERERTLIDTVLDERGIRFIEA